jgi:hypothetical protein
MQPRLLAHLAGEIVKTVKVPVSIDFEAGYSDKPTVSLDPRLQKPPMVHPNGEPVVPSSRNTAHTSTPSSSRLGHDWPSASVSRRPGESHRLLTERVESNVDQLVGCWMEKKEHAMADVAPHALCAANEYSGDAPQNYRRCRPWQHEPPRFFLVRFKCSPIAESTSSLKSVASKTPSSPSRA